MQVCRSARGSVCQGPVRNSTWLSFSTARQRQTPRPRVPAARQYYYFLRTDSRRHSVGLTFVPQHEGKAAWVVHHRWLLPAACELPHSGGVRKSRSRPALRQVLVSYPFRIRLAFGVMNQLIFYDPVVLDKSLDLAMRQGDQRTDSSNGKHVCKFQRLISVMPIVSSICVLIKTPTDKLCRSAWPVRPDHHECDNPVEECVLRGRGLHSCRLFTYCAAQGEAARHEFQPTSWTQSWLEATSLAIPNA